ncbi:MAG: HAMP domain-containing sensor histidine kinase, partial [Pseudomonadota bacterium]
DQQEKAELAEKLADLEQRNADRSQLFAAMSHELRTPLNAIIGFSELLEGKAAIRLDDDRKLEYAGLINTSANHLLSLINDVLDLSKLEAGKQELLISDISIADQLDATRHMLSHIAAQKGVDITLQVDEFIPVIRSDERMLQQVFTNILSNAVKFSPDGAEVLVSAKRRSSCVEISIADHGIGMGPETLEKLGSAFFQAGPSISRDYKGTGLGLSIVYKLVELLDAKISVDSRKGQGTVFTLALPFSTEKPVPVAPLPAGEVVYVRTEKKSPNSGAISMKNKSG